MTSVQDRAAAARHASLRLRGTSADERNAALEAVAHALEERRGEITAANDADRAAGSGLAPPLAKRLAFGSGKQEQAVRGVRSVAALPDPLGKVLSRRELDTELILSQETTPIGVIAMIFESRPDALVQIASLALKSGNALILKGGSEARESNRILAEVVSSSSTAAGMPEGWIQLVETREDVGELLGLDEYIDLMIPRGSNEFVRYIMDHTRIPVLGHADGLCHVYLDRDVDVARAAAVTVDSKTQYVAVCNAAETLLVHRDAAEQVLPVVAAALEERGVELRGCERSRRLVPSMIPARQDDWETEYLDLIISVKVVDDIESAIDHINRYGSGHTDAIVSDNPEAQRRFESAVDSASVMVNASTRFADGFRYGLGAEVGISTSRIHARGPVGVEGLITYRWIVRGTGQVVSDYESGTKRYTHRDLPLS